MPSQEKSTAPRLNLFGLAAEIAPPPDRESRKRIETAAEVLLDVLSRINGCLKDLRELRESLKGPAPAKNLLNPEELESFRPGDWIAIGGFHSGFTCAEDLVRYGVSFAINSTDDPAGLESVTRSMVMALSGIQEADRLSAPIQEALQQLSEEQAQAIADAGRRNGWVEVRNEA